MNADYQARVEDFLAQRRIAVAGYSTQKNQPANAIYDRLEKNGYEVYAINPKAQEVDDVPCYPDLHALPVRPDAVMICTPPGATRQVLEDCHQLGISRAWIHRSIDQGSYDESAERYAREKGIALIPIGCPMMHLEPDIFHRCMRWVMDWRGKLKLNSKSEGLSAPNEMRADESRKP